MNIVNATYAKNHFGELMDSAQEMPVLIEKSGRPYAYVISKKKFDLLQELENRYWINEAKQGKKSGYLSNEESLELFDNLLNKNKKKKKVIGKSYVETTNFKKSRKILKKIKKKPKAS